MDVKFTLTPNAVAREIEMAGKTNSEERPASEFLHQLGQRAPLDSGWMPPGLRSYAQAGNYAQMVIECVPGINLVNWGDYEGDSDAKTYTLAQPWRILIADFVDGNLLGARMFYSPVPFVHPDQQLFHANVPNLNCKGYGQGNGVGWLCLYHGESWREMTLGQKVARVIERCSGVETYNDGNMSETDGPRFYEEHGKPSFVTDPSTWEKKTEEEGFEWTLDADLWIPVMVNGEDDQGHHVESGVPLTLRMAMNGKYNAYYGDSYHPKPSLALRRGEEPEDLFVKVIQESYNQASTKKGVPNTPASTPITQAAPQPVQAWAPPPWNAPGYHNCSVCEHTFEAPDDWYGVHWGVVCEPCWDNMIRCMSCSVGLHENDEFAELHGDTYCMDCKNFEICTNCGMGEDQEEAVLEHGTGDPYCQGCASSLKVNLFTCTKCDKENVHVSEKFALNHETTTGVTVDHELCNLCATSLVLCANCGDLAPTHDVVTTKQAHMVCPDCLEFCNECSYPVGKNELSPSGSCTDCAQPALDMEEVF